MIKKISLILVSVVVFSPAYSGTVEDMNPQTNPQPNTPISTPSSDGALGPDSHTGADAHTSKSGIIETGPNSPQPPAGTQSNTVIDPRSTGAVTNPNNEPINNSGSGAEPNTSGGVSNPNSEPMNNSGTGSE